MQSLCALLGVVVMRREFLIGVCCVFFGAFTACIPSPEAVSTTVAVAGVTAVATPLPPPATQEVPPTPTLTLPPAPTPSSVPDDLSISPGNVYLYPSPNIYSGEKVTFQVLAHVPANVKPADVTVHVLVNYQDVISGTLDAVNLEGGGVGLFEWAWDTTGEPGEHLVHVILDRYDTLQTGDENLDNNMASLPVTVLDRSTLSRSEQNAVWITTQTNCCVIHVVRGTAADRDLDELIAVVETAVQQAAAKLDVQPNRKLDVYLVDRVIGQGGYAGYSVVVSYVDRSYANNGLSQVMVHEMVHILDRQFAPERISFLAEGLALWASEGHYKPENIDERSAALVATGHYVPLAELIDSFYPVQHEIGYLEAGGFVKFLIDSYGWRQFRQFYSDVTAEDAATLSTAVDLNLQKYFNVTLASAETMWLNYLAELPLDPVTITDLETTVRYYNVMRRYQQRYDPTAYFLTAWLPHPETVEQKGNPADLTRHPQDEVNITLEVMLYAADTALRAGDYTQANLLLDSVTRVLDNDGAFIDPLASNYLQVVQAAAEFNYEAQQVALTGNRAVVTATPKGTTDLIELTVILSGSGWMLWR